ncbi:MAG TPA: FAD-dependent oxidoreductase, partial [Candidatus Paceibacterota bacterium]|nr:FAD-dependent oxidoreductase [Candidatus Paceibacterota bacterium]
MNWTKRAWERSRAALALTLLLSGWTLRGWPGTPPTARDTPAGQIREEYDVVIAGAGTGGFGAAVQAARLGAAVLLLEETDWIGGQMTAAAVTS